MVRAERRYRWCLQGGAGRGCGAGRGMPLQMPYLIGQSKSPQRVLRALR